MRAGTRRTTAIASWSLAALVLLSAAAPGCCFGWLPSYDDEAARAAAVRYAQEHQAEVSQRSGCAAGIATAIAADAVSHGTSGDELASQVSASIGDCLTMTVTVVLIGGVWTAVGATFNDMNGEVVTLGAPGDEFHASGHHHDLFD